MSPCVTTFRILFPSIFCFLPELISTRKIIWSGKTRKHNPLPLASLQNIKHIHTIKYWSEESGRYWPRHCTSPHQPAGLVCALRLLGKELCGTEEVEQEGQRISMGMDGAGRHPRVEPAVWGPRGSLLSIRKHSLSERQDTSVPTQLWH